MSYIKNSFPTSPRFLIASLLSLAVIMTLVFTSAVAYGATPNILAGENLTVGAKGPSVVMLQALLSETGYLTVPVNVPLGYFGPLTKNALARYQAATNVAPAVGYFGPITKVSMYNDYRAHGWLTLLGW